jgi:hypothetical protein
LVKNNLVSEKPSPKDLREYITWVLTQDANNNPVTDLTGERCSRHQGIDEVWYLPGGTHNENKIARECPVPSNTKILILAATSDSSYLEHKVAQNDDQLLAIAKETANLHKNVEIKIIDEEGTEQRFGDLEWIETPAFPIIIPENNIYKILYGVKGGYTHLAIVAVGIKVKLEPGKYTVILKAQHDAKDLNVPGVPGVLHAPRFNLDIEYKLTAIPEKEPIRPFARYHE